MLSIYFSVKFLEKEEKQVMSPWTARVALAILVSVPFLGCHRRSDDGGGLVNVRTNNGVHVRAPFVNVHVSPGESEPSEATGPALLPPVEPAFPE